MTTPCEDGCNVPLYTPPGEVLYGPTQEQLAGAEVPNDDFGGKVASAPAPKIGDSSDKKIDLPHRNASWPAERLIEYVRQHPFVTLAPGEAYHIIEHYERRLAGPLP